MKIINRPKRETWDELCQRPVMETDFLDTSVKNILSKVKSSGDAALRELTLQFDKVQLTELQVSQEEINEAVLHTPANLKKAIRVAYQNIEKFHSAQRLEPQKIETTAGVVCWRKPTAIDKVGIYIPGGSAPLFSTVLMLGVPAKLAQCGEVILCTPPNPDGKITSAILFAAQLVGINKIF